METLAKNIHIDHIGHFRRFFNRMYDRYKSLSLIKRD